MASQARAWLPILGLFADLLATAPGHTAQYVVDGIGLGDSVALSSLDYQSYKCRQSDVFADATLCQRTQQMNGSAGKLNVAHTLIHAQDGTAIYIMANAAPVTLSKPTIKEEIQKLSNVIGQAPAEINWLPPDNGGVTAVIAVWGQVRLEKLGWDDLSTLSNGRSPHVGMLVDFTGNLQSSAKNELPIYRIVGGAGYVYSASFAPDGRGHRHYVAIDPLQLAARQFQPSLDPILQKDRSLADDDYRIWPDVAFAARKLARDTSPQTANDALDRVFDKVHSNKLRSHVWSILPAGGIERLAAGMYSKLDVYGVHTRYPQIRADMESLIASNPTDPFIEFAYFTIGDFDKALKTKPKIIGNLLHYAIGYAIIQTLLEDSLKIAGKHIAPKPVPRVEAELKSLLAGGPDDLNRVSDIRIFLLNNPDYHGNKPLSGLISNFDSRADAARAHFEAVLSNPSSVHADDSAYMLGWLAFHQQKKEEELSYFSKAMILGNTDYEYAALRIMVKILEQLPPDEKLKTVESSEVFSKQPALWYFVARSAYRDFDYALAIAVAQRALRELNVPIDRLPVTTDPSRIETALESINPKLVEGDLNTRELPYLIEASREILQYKTYLDSFGTESPDVFSKKVRAIIVKYSMVHDVPGEPAHVHPVAHKDLRQAISFD